VVCPRFIFSFSWPTGFTEGDTAAEHIENLESKQIDTFWVGVIFTADDRDHLPAIQLATNSPGRKDLEPPPEKRQGKRVK